jgi:hypothetical protein
MRAGRRNARLRPAEPAVTQSKEHPRDPATGYVRRVYASTRDWYAVAETKAQLLLTINGIFITILFGTLFGRAGGARVPHGDAGPETWTLLAVSVAALACAAGCLWSLHGDSDREFARLKVDPADPASYRPEVLWYFGHLARLQPAAAAEQLRTADEQFEAEALSHNVVDLSAKVLRKHRWVNAGWAFTALALIALIAAGTSLFIRAQL